MYSCATKNLVWITIENSVLILIFDVSTLDLTEGHIVQDEAVARQGDEVHDVSQSGK